jgi:hypothetical protein
LGVEEKFCKNSTRIDSKKILESQQKTKPEETIKLWYRIIASVQSIWALTKETPFIY